MSAPLFPWAQSVRNAVGTHRNVRMLEPCIRLSHGFRMLPSTSHEDCTGCLKSNAGPERMKNVSGTHRNVIETSSGDGRQGQAGRRAVHSRIGQTAAEGSHISCPWGQNRPNGRRGEAVHSRIGQTAAEGSHIGSPWGQNRPNGRREEAVHRRIGQTAAEGSRISCPWGQRNRNLIW